MEKQAMEGVGTLTVPGWLGTIWDMTQLVSTRKDKILPSSTTESQHFEAALQLKCTPAVYSLAPGDTWAVNHKPHTFMT